METQTLITGFPFVDHVDQQLRPTIPLNYLDRAYTPHHSASDNLLRYGVYKLMGYRYDFKPYLKLYLYKQHGDWREAYAPNKTKLRAAIYGSIDKIIVLDDNAPQEKSATSGLISCVLTKADLDMIRGNLKSLETDCNMAISGEWDVTTEEGRESFNNMIELINQIQTKLK